MQRIMPRESAPVANCRKGHQNTLAHKGNSDADVKIMEISLGAAASNTYGNPLLNVDYSAANPYLRALSIHDIAFSRSFRPAEVEQVSDSGTSLVLFTSL